MTPRVFLDTSVVKHSFRASRSLRPRQTAIEWGGKVHDITVHDFVTADPAARVKNARLKQEIDLLTKVADLAVAGQVELLWHHEANDEFGKVWLAPSGGQPELLKAPITWVKGPIKYSRMVSPHYFFEDGEKKDVQLEFLKAIKHKRFLQLQKATGADQGVAKNANQLLDAFHIWCAESGGATHFLTTDGKLVRHVQKHKRFPPKVKVVLPSELLLDIEGRKVSRDA